MNSLDTDETLANDRGAQNDQGAQKMNGTRGMVPTGPDAEEDVAEVGLGDFFHRIYQVTYSKTVGLVIILVMAVFVLIGVLIVQAPSTTWADLAAREAFLEQARTKYGGWTSLLSLLGFFHIFSSIGFLVVTAALAISIIGCTTHRIPQLWHNWQHPRVAVSAHFFDAARYRSAVPATAQPDKVLQVAEDKLKAAHYRVVSSGQGLYADKYAWGGFGTVVAHLSFIIILIAFVISGRTGHDEVVNLAVDGDPVAVADSGLTIQVTNFESTFVDGRPLDYVSRVVLREGDAVVAEQDVRVNQPLRYGKWAFHQNSYGLGLVVHVNDAQSQTVFSGLVTPQWSTSDGTLNIGSFNLPDLGLQVDVLTLASGATRTDLAAGQAAFVIYRDGESEAMSMNVVDQGASVVVGDLTFFFDREASYSGIQIRSDPGAIWMLIGSILLVGGMTVTFSCRHRRVWLRAADGQLYLASADKEDSGFRREFDELSSQAATWIPERNK